MEPGTRNPERCSDRILLVTGGSRGIGAATARLAAGQGYAVAINYVSNREAADSVVREIEAAGGTASAVQADVSVEADVCRMFDEVDRRLGVLTALVNNAGILEQQMRVEQMTAARLNRIFAVNITGSFLCAREAVRRMSTARGGRGGAIVNVSSGAARLGSPGEYVDYAASKGATDTLTIGLSREVAEEGIRVNAVRPGFIYTEIHASGGEPARVDRVKAFVPMKRGGLPEEVARAIMWLLSDDASYSTGTFIDVTGGK
jgi:NAD(P)-dependent dehydrogenase (short-subunit alcohol dehydrogenase family)